MKMNNLITKRHEFKVNEWVHVGGNRNVVAEVLDTKEEQLKVRILTQPNKGKILYTTKYTYYTIPIPEEEKQKIAQLLGIDLPKSVAEKRTQFKKVLEELVDGESKRVKANKLKTSSTEEKQVFYQLSLF